ncbi:unnamed protein product [Symbiodinium microadriaticum]|nr:unnamed protein product [Symbiodinium microadriaticum]
MLLSTGGRDSLDAAEWRDRFESCLAEKQALLERVDMLTGGAGRTGRGRLTAPDGGEGQAPSKSVEKAYLALREEYKEFRRKVLELEQEREKRRDRRRRDEAEGGGASCVSEEIAGSSGSSSRTRRRAGGDGAEASKLQYVRHLILQYLSCKEPVLRDHMEQAIVTIFRFNDRERERILERKKEENPEEAVLSSVRSIVNTLGMNY